MKTRSIYRCTACGHSTPRWAGKCQQCESWNTLVEEIEHRESRGSSAKLVNEARSLAQVLALDEVDTSIAPRLRTGIAELDRVLGGGLTPGSIVLVGGDPGLGKSTLMLQMSASQQGTALYVTGEESLHQIKLRSDRLGLDARSINVCSETNIETIVAIIERMKPSVAIIDSVQTMITDTLDSSPGSVGQVRECTALLTRCAKSSGIPVVIIGHVTKDGMIAGPKVLEHMVDTVLQFEGDGMYSYRVLRALKNRYGSTNEIGVFDMAANGLHEVPNPSEMLLSHRRAGEPGTAIVAVMEGTRPLLVEVQALVSASGYSVPQRVSTGYETKRLQMILAILEKRGGVQLRQSDVFVNIAGGIAIQDPAIDLAVAVALASSVMDAPAPSNAVFIGELGLTGEVRHVSFAEQRVQESLRLGLKNVYLSGSSLDSLSVSMRPSCLSVDRISPLLSTLFG